MSITKEQQQALEDALVPREQRLRIENCNYRLSTTFKPKEPTFQVALDVLSLTPFYQAFLISAKIIFYGFALIFLARKKKFLDPPFERNVEYTFFIRKLGYTEIFMSLSDVLVDTPTSTLGEHLKNHPSTNVSVVSLGRYTTYYEFATGKVIPKPSIVTAILPRGKGLIPAPISFSTVNVRLKATAKVAKSGKKKLHAQGLETLSEISLFEADQRKVITKRSKTQFYSSHASGSGANKGTGRLHGVPRLYILSLDREELISWISQVDGGPMTVECKLE
ncbi:hypothetical protein Tco_0374312 [Tanacetum coccineum]|uniref:Uncharacterized protein n=1 Tax=Tanacetum coccineum TaxID=301880 RepID=A0ABQ5DW24_9ASTR